MVYLADLKIKPKIIGLVGNICTGKKPTIRYLGRKLPIYVIPLSDYFKEAIFERKPPKTREGYTAKVLEMTKVEGQTWISQRIEGDIPIELGKVLVIDNFRVFYDIGYMSENYGAYFIGLKADEDTLVKRVLERNRDIDFNGIPEDKRTERALEVVRFEDAAFNFEKMFRKIKRLERRYVIDTSGQTDCRHLHSELEKALVKFGLI